MTLVSVILRTFTSNMSLQFLIFPLLLPLFSQFVSSEALRVNSSTDGSKIQCLGFERKALQKFRTGLTDPSGRLASWVGKDCCRWNGVICSKRTGHVVKLDLGSQSHCSFMVGIVADDYSSSCLSGEISPSLLDLKYLTYLDLSMNNFQGIKIPSFLGSLENLRYLNLSYASFSGMVPPHLGNLSNLQYLDLSAAFPSFGTNLVSDLNWTSGLSSLKYLDLGGVNLSKAIGWFEAVNRLASLSELHLPHCELHDFPLSNLNFSSLSVIDISDNDVSSLMPLWLFNISTIVRINLSMNRFKGGITDIEWERLCKLQYLDISINDINGDISELLEGLSRCSISSLRELNLGTNDINGQLSSSLGRLKNLRSLLISENSISGPIPASIGNLPFLEELDLSFNKMNGFIPESVGKLRELTKLQLYQNSWEGRLSQDLLKGFTTLKEFSLSSSDKTFVFDVSHEWVPSFSLQSLKISDFPLGPRFPSWLRNQKELSSLILKNVSISETIPGWLFELSPQIEELDLSHNQIGGVLPNLLDFSYSVDLSFNHLKGPIPLCPHANFLYLGNNMFSGSIPSKIGEVMPSLLALDLSSNFLNGTIPSSLVKSQSLITLDLSKNQFSGKIPRDWKGMQNLQSLDLSNNNLSGNFPASLCSLPFLDWLKMSSNNLSGDLFSSLENCTRLSSLDVGDNRFSGNIPEWIGEKLLSISELRIRANMFSGNVPEKLCSLSDLHILDFAKNNLSGPLPPCLGNLSGFKSLASYKSLPPSLRLYYTPEMDLAVKGRQYQYTLLLDLIHIIDLSSNSLSGDFPEEITNLSSLNSLNLSRNQLTGKIPEKVGDLKRLETLDLSSNRLSGPIPPSMSSITTLSHLNLSYNNLSGPIPSTNQFKTFDDPSIYEGNTQLCGPPLTPECGSSSPRYEDVGDNNDEDEDDFVDLWFFVSMGLGFIMGFWVVCGSLMLKKSWRYAYFQFLIDTKDWIYVIVAIKTARLLRMMKRGRPY